MPILSIIVPMFNVADYLDECLDSIERQKLTDIEVILIDDGSTDTSREIAQARMAAKPQLYRLLSQTNQGASIARNLGITSAKGDWLLFLDADDLLADTGIELLIQLAEQQQLDIIIGNFIHLYDNNDRVLNRSLIVSDKTSGEAWLTRSLAKRKYQPAMWYRLYRREFICQHKIMFIPGLASAHDQLFSAQALVAARFVAAYDLPFYLYRHRSGSITTDTSIHAVLRRLNGNITAAEEMKKFAQQHGNPRLTRLLLDQSLRPVATAFAAALTSMNIANPQLEAYLQRAELLAFHHQLRIRRWSQLIDYICLRHNFNTFLRWRQWRQRKQ